MVNMSLANMTSTTMHAGYFNTTNDHFSTEATESKTQTPSENFTEDFYNQSEPLYTDYGEWIGIVPPMAWKIPHFENLFVYGLGICLFFGTFGNVFSFAVMLRRRMRKLPTTPYLCSLAVADVLILWVFNQEDWFHKVVGRRLIDNIPCSISYYFACAFGMWSTWLIVFLTGERFLVIRFPLKTLHWSKPSRARYILVVMLPVISFLLTCPYMFIYKETIDGCMLVEGPFSAGYDVAYLVVRDIIPIFVITICNVLIIVYLTAKRQNIGQSPGRSREILNLPILSLVVSVTYIFLAFPLEVFIAVLTVKGLLGVSDESGDMFAISTENLLLIQMIVYVLAYINHSINFLLYIVVSPRFREELLQIIA